jgi:hypothetical protein
LKSKKLAGEEKKEIPPGCLLRAVAQAALPAAALGV